MLPVGSELLQRLEVVHLLDRGLVLAVGFGVVGQAHPVLPQSPAALQPAHNNNK